MNAQTRPLSTKRRLFLVGRIHPRRHKVICRLGWHIGPLVDTERFDNFDEPGWEGIGICAACGSSVHRDQLRKGAA